MANAPLHSGNAVIDTLFRLCVDLLLWLGDLFGVSYFTINIVIFCILWPALSIASFVIILRQRRIIRRLTEELRERQKIAP